ncbi:MAG: hypothetical protein MT490_07490 [Sphingomonas sp.]|uniref:hypothetical protein n=1 Tax=Sphingomonas sp. TaxID=28214 RepID=UPI002274AEE2|nr:hypothetical protein [Sphingomonas sp.]MCX8475627.1 hypothetical protein [Sphingomonas sp.]
MDRRDFIAGTVGAAAAAMATPLAASPRGEDEATLAVVTDAADREAAAILSGSPRPGFGARAVLRQMRLLLTPFVWPRSAHYHKAELAGPIEQLLAKVEAAQHDDGTFSSGNRHSPPDTSFLIADMAAMIAVLRNDRHPSSAPIASRLAAMMRKAGPALLTGGIHTPNHRWELCAALARIDRVDPRPAYRDRIDDWLGEGIDIDSDGNYSERSPNYAGEVSNPSLLALARLPGLSGLRDLVRRNLETTIVLAEPGSGDVETILSRRQDQDQRRQTLHTYYLQFRELALADGNGRFAGVTRWIERHEGASLGETLGDFLERPELMRPLPPERNPFTDVSRLFAPVGLVRQRRGPMTASFYAGSDWYADGKPSPFYNRIGSGLATNPTLARLWKGGLALDAVRLIPDFFNMGHFRPATIAMDPDGTVRMAGEMQVPYYLPLPRDRRRADGAYPMTASVDRRFNSALDFDHRPASFRRLGIRIAATPEPTGYHLLFETDGEQDVDMTIELTLRDGGVLEGARQLPDGGFQLVEGHATYQLGRDRLTIGPGNGAGQVKAGPGENYAWVGGRLQLPGTRLYITGRTPFRYELRLAFA